MYSMDKLKKIRKKSGLTIYDMADKLGITASFYSQIENKKRRLFYDIFNDYEETDVEGKDAEIFKTKPDNLFYIKEK